MCDKNCCSELLAGLRRPFNQTVQRYSLGDDIFVEKGMFAYMFTNVGDTIALVNNMIIYPGVPGTRLGDSRSISGHVLSEYKGRIILRFQGAGAAPLVEIVQLYYMDGRETVTK